MLNPSNNITSSAKTLELYYKKHELNVNFNLSLHIHHKFLTKLFKNN